MSAQTRYSYSTPRGAAGGIYDLAPVAIDTFLNEEEAGKMKFGIGVVEGSVPGTYIKVPAEGATAAKFEGVTTNNRTTEFDMDGKLSVRKDVAVGVMRYGRIWVRVPNGVEPKHGEPAYMVASGEEAGFFTNVKDGAVAVKARFLTGIDAAGQVAVIELFNQAQV